MSSGDVGRFDDDGRLFVEGRDDEMIVSGGENVFPKEVEDCLARHESVVEVAAIGVDDDDFGQAAARRSWWPTGDVVRGRPQGLGEGEPRPLQGAPRDRLPRRAAPQRHRQGAQARADRGRLTPVTRTSSGSGAVGRGWEDGGTMSRTSSDLERAGLALGGPAPDFTLRDQFGQDVTLSSYRGRKAVAIVFYPYAFSGVCTGEMSGIRDRLAEFLTFDTEVLAISCDPVYSLRAFADQDGLNFPLLSDFWPHGEVARAYDVFDEAEGQRPTLVVRRRQGRRDPLVGAQREPRRSGSRRAPEPAARAGLRVV